MHLEILTRLGCVWNLLDMPLYIIHQGSVRKENSPTEETTLDAEATAARTDVPQAGVPVLVPQYTCLYCIPLPCALR